MEHQESSLKIYFTKEYGRFRMIEGNRQLNETKINRIIADIEDGIDVLKYYPIQVKENGGILDIADGQHRFWIAKKLGKSVHYIIMQDTLELPNIARINSNVEKWKTKDFINCYVQLGNKNYIQLQEFMDAFGLSATLSVKLLSTGSPTNSDFKESFDFNRGEFEVKYWDEALTLADICQEFRDFKHWKSHSFVLAIYKIIKSNKVDIRAIVDKYKKSPEELTPQSGYREYIFNLEAIYNKSRKDRIIIWDQEN